MRGSVVGSCLAVLSLTLSTPLWAESATVRVTGGDCRTIQQAINSLPPEGGEVIVEAGTYACQEFIHIDRDNVTLRGVGTATLLRLQDRADSPVLVLGQRAVVPAETRRNIRILDLAIDGNRRNQTMECFRGPCSSSNPLRNNGITVRGVVDALVENVVIVGARSGGLVTELTSRRITVRGLTASDNEFDGLAGYQTEESLFSALYLHNNLAAGISLDIDFNNNVISDVFIVQSGRVGIFMRDSRDNTFAGVRIRQSGEHGVFCAQVDTDSAKPCAGNTFHGLVVSDSKGAGFRVNDASCVNNLVDSAQLFGNAGGCISEATSGLVVRGNVVCR